MSYLTRGAGCRIHGMGGSDIRVALARTRGFVKDPEGALDACHECVEYDPEGPIGDTARIMAIVVTSCFSLISRAQMPSVNFDELVRGTKEPDRVNANAVLENGLATAAQCSDAGKRANLLKFLDAAAEQDARALRPLFEEARIEANALLVDGKTRAMLEGKTRDDVYDDAETYYAAYTGGDLAGALRGFKHLKSLNPGDAYMRSMTGAILLQQGKVQDAMHELLYGFHLDPGYPKTALNLVRELTLRGLHSASYEVAQQNRRHRRADTDPPADEAIDRFARFNEIILQVMAWGAAGLTADDFDERASNVWDELPVPERPWLTAPQQTDTEEPALDEARIFISYRRADSADLAQRLHRKVKTSHPRAHVFLDEAEMVGGERFADRIREEITQASIVLVLMGEQWESRAGLKRLHQSSDVLRREVAWALNRNKPIVPVLVEDTPMPTKDQLPDQIAALPDYHAVRVRTASFDADWARLHASMIREVTERVLRARATEQQMKEIFDKEDTDPDAADRDFGRLAKDWKETLPKFIDEKAAPGQGVSDSIELHGIWEGSAAGGGDEEFSFRVRLEPRNQMTGVWRVHDHGGDIVREVDLEGEWIRIWDRGAEKVLGVELRYLERNKPQAFRIPFDRRVGKALVGTDARGYRFSSRNIEPHPGGF